MASRKARAREARREARKTHVYGRPRATYAVWAATIPDLHLRLLYARVSPDLRIHIARATAFRCRITAGLVIRALRERGAL